MISWTTKNITHLVKVKQKSGMKIVKKSVKDDKRFYSVESEWVMKIQWEDRYDQCGTNLPIFLACEHGEEWDIIVDDAFFKYSSQ